MRTNIDIQEELMEKAMKLSGAKTRRAAVDLALRLLVRLKQQDQTKKFRGKLRWEGDLDAMRSDH